MIPEPPILLRPGSAYCPTLRRRESFQPPPSANFQQGTEGIEELEEIEKLEQLQRLEKLARPDSGQIRSQIASEPQIASAPPESVPPHGQGPATDTSPETDNEK